MNILKQAIRIRYVRFASKQRRVNLHLKGFAPIQTKLQFDLQKFNKQGAYFSTSHYQFDLPSRVFQNIPRKPNESFGLLDLVGKSKKNHWEADAGDFACVSQENFTHTLNYTQVELDMGNFNLDEMETVVSQNIDQSIVFELKKEKQVKNDKGEQKLNHSMSEEEAKSMTETDIYFELPYSELIESKSPKPLSRNRSASF